MKNCLKEVLDEKGENYILPFFWQHGESDQVIVEELEKIQSAGISAVCIEARPHPDFGGTDWWRNLDLILVEAEKRQMKVWLLDDSHFPTGYANGWIKDRFPGKGRKFLMMKAFDVHGPMTNGSIMIDAMLNHFDWQHPDEKLLGEDCLLTVCAAPMELDQPAGDTVELSGYVSRGKLHWNFPEGVWRIFVLIETRNWGGDPYYINMVDESSVQVLIDAVYEPHYERYKNYFGNTFAGFFSDEPSFGNTRGFHFNESIGRKDMVIPWSSETKEVLEKRLGQNFRRLLPYLWQDAACAGGIRYVYMDVITELYRKNFVSKIGRWCSEHNVEYIGHVIEDQNVHSRLGCGSGHFFRALEGQHMSGIDIIADQVIPRYEMFCPDTENSLPSSNVPGNTGVDYEFFHFGLAKLGASLGHIDPKKKGRTICEIFGASGWSTGLRNMKWLTDHALVRGVNHFVPHAFSPKDFPDSDCPPHFYARGYNPQYRYFGELMKYTNRLCHLLNGGTHIATAAVLYHGEAEWSGRYMYFQRPVHELMRRQIDCDIVPSDIFLNRGGYKVSFSGDSFYINDEVYKCLIIPETQFLTEAVYNFITEVSGSNFPVIFINQLPEGIVRNNGELIPAWNDKIFKQCESVPLKQLADRLIVLGLADMRVGGFVPYLRCYHYQNTGLNIYMFFNEHPAKDLITEVALKESGELYQYDAFENSLLTIDSDNEGRFELALQAYESVVIIAGKVEKADNVMGCVNKKGSEVAPLHGEWTVSLADSKEYPDFHDPFILKELADMSSEEYFPRFSGTFKYEIEINVHDPTVVRMLDLGEVYEVSVLQVNGRRIGCRICPPYIFCLEGLLNTGKNQLIVEVTNTLVKELDDPFSMHRIIEPSGLIGPVTIISEML